MTRTGDRVTDTTLSRRSFFEGCVLGGVGLTAVPRLLSALPRTIPGAKADAVIQIFLQGGLSHIDTFDPKPNAPVENRGEFRTVKSKLDGEPLSEVLRRTAAIADRLTIVRSMTHSEAAHERGTHNMLTGYRPSPAITYPSFGAVVSERLGSRKDLPPYVSIPNAASIYLGTGYLSTACGAFTPGSDPNRAGFKVRDLSPSAGVNRARFESRRKLLEEIDGTFETEADAIRATEAFYDQAYRLIESKTAREAFRINREKKQLREAYGRTGIGQRLLLARRLAEAGVRYQVVLDGGYDNHQRLFPSLRAKMGAFDQGFAALIRDLDQRGSLSRTLVLVTSEFGRTPRINPDAGRDHWPRVFSVVLAGAGIKRGFVHGASNAIGAEVDAAAVSPADLAATMFSQIGIDPTTKLISPGGRPIDIVRSGRVLHEILA